MATSFEVLSQLEDRNADGARTGYQTGLVWLDEATGGLELGQVWIIASTPGQGRSTLALQWAVEAALVHGLDTLMVSRRDPEPLTAARLFAGVGRISVGRLWNSQLTEDDSARLDGAKAQLRSAPLTFIGPSDPFAGAYGPASTQQVVVVDDADLAHGLLPQQVARLAGVGKLLILTLPLEAVTAAGQITPEWARVADVILCIDRPDAEVIDRTGAFTDGGTRPGEADLHLLRNRWGPVRTFITAFQGEYARFVDIVVGG